MAQGRKNMLEIDRQCLLIGKCPLFPFLVRTLTATVVSVCTCTLLALLSSVPAATATAHYYILHESSFSLSLALIKVGQGRAVKVNFQHSLRTIALHTRTGVCGCADVCHCSHHTLPCQGPRSRRLPGSHFKFWFSFTHWGLHFTASPPQSLSPLSLACRPTSAFAPVNFAFPLLDFESSVSITDFHQSSSNPPLLTFILTHLPTSSFDITTRRDLTRLDPLVSLQALDISGIAQSAFFADRLPDNRAPNTLAELDA